MEPDNEKIRSPFEVPEGYFEGFEARLAEKLADKNRKLGQLTVSHKRTFKVEWIAVAATIGAIVVSAWFIFKPQNPINTQPIAKIKRVDTVAIKPAEVKPDSAILAKNERAAVESVIEEVEAKDPSKNVVKTPMNPAEISVAIELEDAGLIVLDAGDGLFDDIEIQP